MNRRYPDADDLWQAIEKEGDAATRREMLAQMARILLELEDSGWTDKTQAVADSTTSLLDYQSIGKLAATHIQQSLPWLDPDYKGEALEQALQQSLLDLQNLTVQTEEILQQQTNLKKQQVRLMLQQQDLESQQQSLQEAQQTLERTQQDILVLQQAITSMEEAIAQLKKMLDQQDAPSQQVHITRLLEEFGSVFKGALGHYRQLLSVYRLHLDENAAVTKVLALEAADGNGMPDVENLVAMTTGITHQLEKYDSLLSGLIRAREA